MPPTVQLIQGDSLALFEDVRGFRNDEGKLVKADACVTDPPYELGFMGRAWDSTGIAYNKQLWRGLISALKPGAHLVAFSGSRTAHRMTCAIEDAGWEIRDVLMWLYGQGFPKSLDISKAIDKKKGATRAVVGTRSDGVGNTADSQHTQDDRGLAKYRGQIYDVTAPATDKAQQWAGWGTALKPAYEPITLARAPFAQMKVDDKAIVENVMARGTGAINIDGCRLEARGVDQIQGAKETGQVYGEIHSPGGKSYGADLGRWPANILLDADAAEALDAQTGDLGVSSGSESEGEAHPYGIYSSRHKQGRDEIGYGDRGGASRFFYCAKPSRKERDYGCDDLPLRTAGEVTHRQEGSAGTKSPRAGAGRTEGGRNFHPTVKPIELMRWLVRLITPPGGTVIDPFMGSGTTGIAAILEGFNFIGIEKEADHFAICQARIAQAVKEVS